MVFSKIVGAYLKQKTLFKHIQTVRSIHIKNDIIQTSQLVIS